MSEREERTKHYVVRPHKTTRWTVVITALINGEEDKRQNMTISSDNYGARLRILRDKGITEPKYGNLVEASWSL